MSSSHPPIIPLTEKSNNKKKSFFLSCPGEIRNQIYTELVVSSSPIVISPARKSSRPPGPGAGQSPSPAVVDDDDDHHHQPPPLKSKLLSIFLVNRQIHLEASSIFYSHNAFVLPTDSTCLPHHAQVNFLVRWFLDRVGGRNAGFIKSLGLPFPFECLPFYFAGEEGERRGGCGGGGGGGKAGLLDAVWARCPGLERVELDLGVMNCEMLGLRVSGSSEVADAERIQLFGAVEERLREEFARLKEVVVCVGRRRYVSNTNKKPHAAAAVMVSSSSSEWKVEEEDDDYKTRREFRLPEDLWAHYHPSSPLIRGEPDAVLPYQVAARMSAENPSEADGKTRGKRAEFARAFIKSPRQALQERREEKEWLEVRRQMASRWWDQRMCTCFGGAESITRPASSRRKRTSSLSMRGKALLRRMSSP